MKERTAEVFQAEKLRVGEQLAQALELARKGKIPPEKISSLTFEERVGFLSSLRIEVVTLLSLANRGLSGKRSLGYLQEARAVIEGFYHHLTVKNEAPKIKKDNLGNDYDMHPEMLRDEGKCWLRYGLLTGSSWAIRKARSIFGVAYSIATEESCQGIALMEHGIAERILTGKTDFKRIKEGYELAIRKTEEVGNKNRQRWAVVNFALESLRARTLKDLKLALADWKHLTPDTKKRLLEFSKAFVSSFVAEPVSWKIRRLTLL